jgi:hypothetical protein
MEKNTEYILIALTYLEWMNFVDCTQIRINSSRIIHLNYENISFNFDKLMNNLPDISDSDDGSIIILELNKNYLNNLIIIDESITNSIVFLDLSSVEKFIPVTDRGSRLINSESKRLGINLERPIFEKYYFEWINLFEKRRVHFKGINFCKSLNLLSSVNSFLSSDLIEVIHQQIDVMHYLYSNSDDSPRKIAFKSVSQVFKYLIYLDKYKDKLFESKDYFITFNNSVANIDNYIKIERQQINDFILSNHAISEFIKDKNYDKPLYDSFELTSSLYQLNKLLCKLSESNISIFFYLTLFYYILLNHHDMQINMESLFKDIYVLKELISDFEATNATYYIGKNFTNKEVITLYAARYPNHYPLTINKIPFSLELSQYAPKEWKIEDILEKYDNIVNSDDNCLNEKNLSEENHENTTNFNDSQKKEYSKDNKINRKNVTKTIKADVVTIEEKSNNDKHLKKVSTSHTESDDKNVKLRKKDDKTIKNKNNIKITKVNSQKNAKENIEDNSNENPDVYLDDHNP